MIKKMMLAGIMGIALGLAHTGHAAPKHYQTKKYAKKHAKGLRIGRHSHKFMQSVKYVSYSQVLVAVPKSMDLSPWVSLPENQGQCGSCWDFALTKALRSEYMIAGKDPGQLEFNYLLNNCGPGPKMSGCNGGNFSAAQSFQAQAGPGLNSLDPYVGVAKGRCMKLPVKATASSYTMLGAPPNGPTFKDLAYALGVGKHMVVVDVAAAQGEWESYAGGIYDQCQGSKRNIDHMVNLVGYDCESSVDSLGNCSFDNNGKPVHGDGYLIVENNWGENWGTKAANGHGGYMKSRMYGANGKNCNALAVDALIFSMK